MSKLIDTYIFKCKNWDEFVSFVNNQTDNKLKGALFERLTQVFLKTCSPYASKLKNVWWCNNKGEFPEKIRKHLNLPSSDEGIDLICETNDSEFWSVQCKYKANQDNPLTHKELSTFESLSFNTSTQISLGLVVHTSTKPVRKAALMRNVTEIGLDKWLEISDDDWKRIQSYCRTNKLTAPKKRSPRKHQRAAIKDAVNHFSKRSVTRGKLIMPCGTGKSLAAFWIAQALNPKTIIVSVPSLALIRQSLADWTAEYLANGVQPEWIAVCSDETVGKTGDADSTVATVYEAGIPTTTDIESIKHFLKKRSSGPKIIFTTYHSAQRLCDAAKEANKQFDLLICDEAHKTVGSSSKSFSTLLFDENIKVKKRIFMTATERVYKQTSSGKEDVVSMDNPEIYGDVFHQLTFKEAIKQKIICDYKIITIAVTEKEAAALIADNPELRVTSGKDSFETDAHNLSVGLTLQKVFEKYGIRHAVTFHSSIKRATFFTKQQQELLGEKGISNHHISSEQSAGERANLLRNFANDNKAIISNARCLTEGVDIPSIDCVVFADPKKSTVDIVQAAGRAMRQSKATGKEYGYILLPLIIPEEDDLSDFAEETNFKDIARVITSLSTQDERIAEQMRARAKRKSSVPSDIVQIETDIFDLVSIKSEDLSEAISIRVWSSVGRANFLTFEDTKSIVSNFNINSESEWRNFVKKPSFSPDIPKAPAQYYKNKGWISWPDFLGNPENEKKFFHLFSDARKISRSLNVSSIGKWREWTRDDNQMPRNPDVAYKNSGWVNWSDFLNAEIIQTQKREYLLFEECRKFMKSSGIKTKAEFDTQKLDLPFNIPRAPNHTYKDDGFKNWPHFLMQRDTDFLNFEDARVIVQKLNLNSVSQFRKLASSKTFPDRVPSNPPSKYRNDGWNGWDDFLGKENYLTYDECVINISKYELSSLSNYRELIDNGTLNPNLYPRTPSKVYKSEWKGTKAFLGFHPRYRWRNFFDARAWARKQNIINEKQWLEFVKTSDFPKDIPKSPWIVYKNKGWMSLEDWLNQPHRP